MQTPNEPYTILDRGRIVRIQKPEQPGGRVLLLLHGWTGDENVMWIFTRSLPKDFWIFAPRGPVQSPEGGYGWANARTNGFEQFEELSTVASSLMRDVDAWIEDFNIPPGQVNLMGFSQGAALSYAVLINHPARISRTAALAGFIPQGVEIQPGSLSGKDVFIAHGTRDETVPVALARQSAERLEAAGANVAYCEDDVGHKLGASCSRALGTFFQ